MGTFQHVLEGYKIADELAKRHIGGSTFSDWWAYKNEVVDAQAYNGALMHDVGVVVSYNSDSGELARRLNSEAGKAVKYGGVPPEEALKFVTINPAIQLHVQDRVGSLEPGKDADLALWSGAPLEAHTRCEQTWIDGRKYFDRAADLERRKVEAGMRAVLIQKALADPDAGGGGGGAGGRRGPRDVYDEADQAAGDDAADGDIDTRGECGTGGGR
jgi:N-acetylglucosamine-6-phosphate deacetylase